MRQKVKTFFHVFSQSLFPQSDYYQKIPKASFGFSLKYFSSFIIILNLILIIFLTVKYNPGKINRFINSIIINLKTYPEELVINVRKGRLFTSYNRPYLFWNESDGKRNLLLVIDETALPSKINQYRSFLLLTSKEIVIRTDKQPNKIINILPLTYFGNQTFNKKTSQKTVQSLTVFKNLLLLSYLIIVPVLIILLPISSFLINFFYLSVISFIIYIIFKVYFHKRIHYKKTFQVALHAASLPLLLDYFLIIFKPSIQTNVPLKPFIPSPLAFTILLTVFVFAAVYEAYQDHQHQETNHSTHHKSRHLIK